MINAKTGARLTVAANQLLVPTSQKKRVTELASAAGVALTWVPTVDGLRPESGAEVVVAFWRATVAPDQAETVQAALDAAD